MIVGKVKCLHFNTTTRVCVILNIQRFNQVRVVRAPSVFEIMFETI